VNNDWKEGNERGSDIILRYHFRHFPGGPEIPRKAWVRRDRMSRQRFEPGTSPTQINYYIKNADIPERECWKRRVALIMYIHFSH
jgi:hypothetical protein